jgi:tetratricopeptide (TPR) repeat protein
MAKRKVSAAATETVEVQEVKTPTAPFWEQYQQYIMYGLGAIALLFLGWWLYKTQVVAPKQKEAVGAMRQAEAMFERDSFKAALENPGGGFDGFLALADKYSGTPAGNVSTFYAGLCYLQTGDFDNAIAQLESCDGEGIVMPALRYGALGDSYSEKKDFDKALSMYKKAVDATENKMLGAYYLKKLGMLYEFQGNKADAKSAYERLHKEFPNQMEWRDIEKYIYRVSEAK